MGCQSKENVANLSQLSIELHFDINKTSTSSGLNVSLTYSPLEVKSSSLSSVQSSEEIMIVKT